MKTLPEVLQDWEAVIGLEVHTELTTLNTKMFCSCTFDFGKPQNSQVCPICLGLPGALPVPNQAAIESIVMAGLATNCQIMPDTMFYRKHYFYPDMTKNYQITQGPIAYCMNGELELEVRGIAAEERTHRDGTEPLSLLNVEKTSAEANTAGIAAMAGGATGAANAAAAVIATSGEAEGLSPANSGGYRTRVGITRIHLEEDAGKLVHIGGTDGRITNSTYSLVDYNRCGAPLIELVTEPDLRTPEEARLFLQQLRQIYLTLGISNVSMEEGSLRCDGNISIRRRGATEFGTKTELKNMNSFKNLHDGLAYEICRQAEVLESGGTIRQETRHWEPATKRTFAMRTKETSADYRLFPDPDLTPFHLTEQFVESVRARLPELPRAKRDRYMADYAIPENDAAILANDPELAACFDGALAAATGAGTPSALSASELARPVANLLLNEVSAWLRQSGLSLGEARFEASELAELAALGANGTLSSAQVKEVLGVMIESGGSPSQIVTERGISQVSDTEVIAAHIQTVMQANADKVAEYRDGKTGLLGFFVGQVMREMQGQGNPRLISDLLTEKLS